MVSSAGSKCMIDIQVAVWSAVKPKDLAVVSGMVTAARIKMAAGKALTRVGSRENADWTVVFLLLMDTLSKFLAHNTIYFAQVQIVKSQ